LHNQPKFEFDNSYEFPEIKTEKVSEEIMNKTLENQREQLSRKLNNILGNRLRDGSFGYLSDLLGSVENPDIYHIQNIWNGLKGVEELQDSVIRKLERMISKSESTPKVEGQANKPQVTKASEKPLDKNKLQDIEEKKTNSILNEVPGQEKMLRSSHKSGAPLEKTQELSLASTTTAISKEVEKAIDNISKNVLEHQAKSTAASSEKIQEQKNPAPNNAVLQQSLMAALNIAPVSKEVEETKNNNSHKHNNSKYQQRPESSNSSSSVQGRDKNSKVYIPKNGEGPRQQNNSENTGNHKKNRNGRHKKQKEQNGQGGNGGNSGQKSENKQKDQREFVQNVYVPKSNS